MFSYDMTKTNNNIFVGYTDPTRTTRRRVIDIIVENSSKTSKIMKNKRKMLRFQLKRDIL